MLKAIKPRAFCVSYFIFYFFLTSLFEFTVSNPKGFHAWGITSFVSLLFFVFILICFLRIEKTGNKKFLSLFLSFIPNSTIVLIFLLLEKMQVVSQTDVMWPLGTLGGAFFLKPDDIYIPTILILIFWAQQEFNFKISEKNLLLPQMSFWSFCSYWFTTDLMRFGVLNYGIQSDGSWAVCILLFFLTSVAFGGMLSSKYKENGIFWSITLAHSAYSTFHLIYLNTQ